MTATLPRALMSVAARCLGDHRREWAVAMRAEFQAAEEDGRPLAFALGCLIAAWRELPAHEEGRLTLASYALVSLLLVPMSAMLAASVLADFPSSYIGPAEVYGWPKAARTGVPLLNEGNRAAVPSLALLVVLLAASHLRLAWLVLDRDWARSAAVARLIWAVTAALVIFSGVAFAEVGVAIGQAAMSAVAVTVAALLARVSPGAMGGIEDVPK